MTYIQPLTLLLLGIAVIGLIRMRRCRGFRIPMLAVIAMLLLSWPPADWVLSRPLEMWYPVHAFPAAPVQAIVVLASDVRSATPARPYAVPDTDTYERCLHAAWLYKNWHALPVLACGGRNSTSTQPVSIALRDVLEQDGVPRAMIWIEDRSHSTHENALYGAEVLRSHGIKRVALVVEAQSMLRAEMCFRKQGIEVVPAPSDFRTFDALYEEWIPGWKPISRNEVTLHEMAGLVWYRIRGWI